MRKTPRAADDDESWVVYINEELGRESKHHLIRPSITRVPAPLHMVRMSAFTPRTLVIGPFHRKLVTEGLYAFSFAAMEEFKIKAARILSALSSSCPAGAGAAPKPLLEKLAQDIAREEEKVRACYGSEMGLADLSARKLGYMLGLDCLFIVAFMHSFYNDSLPSGTGHAHRPNARWANPSDERLSLPLKKAVMLDLLLLENQVPLFLVKKTMQMICQEDVEHSFQILLDAVVNKALPFCKDVRRVGVRDAKHLLDCLYKIVTHNDEGTHIECNGLVQDDDELQHKRQFGTIPTATKLHDVGVLFKGHHNSLSSVSFKGKILTLPTIHVGDTTDCIFRNLLAYETQLVDCTVVTSYLHFMNSLINTAEDVELLVEAGVITESIGDYKHVARLWNELATNTWCTFTSQYNRATSLARAYEAETIHGMVAELRERYFSRPWLVLSLLSGTALLVMSFITMWYTILVYIKA